jgi:hypothetical protein
MFTADELAQKSGAALDRLAEAARQLNGMADDSVDVAAKN